MVTVQIVRLVFNRYTKLFLDAKKAHLTAADARKALSRTGRRVIKEKTKPQGHSCGFYFSR